MCTVAYNPYEEELRKEVIVGVDLIAKDVGLTFPTSLSKRLDDIVNEMPWCNDRVGRISDILWMFISAFKNSGGGDNIPFSVLLQDTKEKPHKYHLKGCFRSVFNGGQTLTIMMNDETLNTEKYGYSVYGFVADCIESSRFKVKEVVSSYGLIIEKLINHNYDHQKMFNEMQEDPYLNVFEVDVDSEKFETVDADVILSYNNVIYKFYSSYLYIDNHGSYAAYYLD